MGKHKKRSKFFPVVNAKISEHAIDPMGEFIGKAVSESPNTWCSEERASSKNGRKPSWAKKMQRAAARDWRSVNLVSRVR